MKRLMVGFLFLALLLGGGGAWFYFYGPCGVNRVKAAQEEFADVLEDWLEAESAAAATPRIALVSRIQAMEEVRATLLDLEVPGCVQGVIEELAQGMAFTVEAYLAFLEEQPTAVIQSGFDNANLHMLQAEDELDEVQACAPFCFSQD